MWADTNLVAAFADAIAEVLGAAVADQVGLRQPMSAALATLHTRPDLTVDELSRILALSHSGTVRVVDKLASRGLVVRRRGGRTVRLRLTAGGSALASSVLDARRRAVESVLDRLPRELREDLVRSSTEALALLTTGRREARHICRLCDHALCVDRSAVCPVDHAATLLGE